MQRQAESCLPASPAPQGCSGRRAGTWLGVQGAAPPTQEKAGGQAPPPVCVSQADVGKGCFTDPRRQRWLSQARALISLLRTALGFGKASSENTVPLHYLENNENARPASYLFLFPAIELPVGSSHLSI